MSSFADLLNTANSLLVQIKEHRDLSQLEKLSSKQGLLSQLLQSLKDLPGEEKKSAGQALNHLKQEIEDLRDSLQGNNASVDHEKNKQKQDLSIPYTPTKIGRRHPISSAIQEISTIFERIGFTRVRYPEADYEWFPFDALNMPKQHPARDEWETFWIDQSSKGGSPHPEYGRVCLTPHTSNGQIHEMMRLQGKPPIRMVNITRTYRRQADVTHTEMFHQFEGLVVDKGITIQHLKGTIDYFAQEFYGPSAKSRIRPFHFQFTEPSFEVDFSCSICDGTGKDETNIAGGICRFCKSGWHEVGGAGMVHPNVLRVGGIDPEKFTGFAFGWGVERTFTLRQGLKVDDIRLFYNNDLRFLEQFV